MKYYIDVAGHYLGGWDQDPPTGAAEVESAPNYADQIWLFPGWGKSIGAMVQVETEWIRDEMQVVADQLLRIEDGDPSALLGTEKQWRDYRIALRAWKEGAEGFPEIGARPQRPPLDQY